MSTKNIINQIELPDGQQYEIDAKYWGGYETSDVKTINGVSIFGGGNIDVASTSSLNDLSNRVTLVENGEIGNTFFKNFATLSEYETAVANGEVVYPCISYITEDSVIKFEKLPVTTNRATVTVNQAIFDEFKRYDVQPLTLNPEYYEIFEVNGEDYLSNIGTWEGHNVIPFPTFNVGDTFEVKFKFKDEPKYFVENANDMLLIALFYMSLSYLEIDESFYNRVTGALIDDTVREYPIGLFAPSYSPDFTCKFKGDYAITDKKVGATLLSMMFEGMFIAADTNPDTPINWTLQIPNGNETYGNPSDIFDENDETFATFTFYGMINYVVQVSAENSNIHLIIETY